MTSSGAELFFYVHGVGRHVGAREDEVLLVDDGPLDALALGEVHRLGDGRGEVDVELLTVFALDELNFGWITHA